MSNGSRKEATVARRTIVWMGGPRLVRLVDDIKETTGTDMRLIGPPALGEWLTRLAEEHGGIEIEIRSKGQ